MRDATTSGANLDQVDRWHHDWESTAGFKAMDAVYFEHVGEGGSATFDETGLGRGSTHVEREDIVVASELTVETRSEGAGGRS
jgi:hypothetical protein